MTAGRARAGRVALLLAAGAVLAGCGGGAVVHPPTPLTQLNAPAYRMHTIWRTDGGAGPGEYTSGFVPAVTDTRVYVANRDGQVTAIKLANGRVIWRSHTGDRLISGPTAHAGKLLMGTRDGQVIALSAQSGKRLWTASVSSAVIAAPAAANGLAVARTLDGHLVALDLETGERRWSIAHDVPTLTLRGTSSPRIENGSVYAGLDNGTVIAVDLQTGEQQWQQTVALPTGRSELARIVDIDADPLIVGDRLYAVSVGGEMTALSVTSGRLLWKHALAADTGLASDAEHVLTTDRDSVVWAIDALTGDTSWKQTGLKYRELAAPAVYKGDLLVGDYRGYLHWLAVDDGSVIARGRAFDQAIRAAPVVAGDRAIVLGAQGEVAAVGFTASGR